MSVTIIDKKLNKHAPKMLAALRAIVKQHNEYVCAYNDDKIRGTQLDPWSTFSNARFLRGRTTFLNSSAGDMVFDVLAEIDNEN
jgi:N-dimethylarginine dimethylaminohydrolase